MNRRLVRAVLASGLMLAAIGEGTAAETQKVFMMEIAVFTCPASKETNGKIDLVEREVGEHFVFAPISEGEVSPAVRAWYAMRDQSEAPRIRSMLFSLMQDVRMEKPSDRDVAEWLGITAEVDGRSSDIETRMKGAKVGQAVNRAVNLTRRSGVRRVPAFVFVSGGEVVGVVERGEMSADEFIARGLQRYRQLTQSGTKS